MLQCDEWEIKVGVKTLRSPEWQQEGEYNRVKNLLIGDGFHWQTIIEALLPGKIELFYPSTVENSGKCDHGNVTLINTLPLEEYIEIVVGSEMNPAAHSEFVKAHSIISRSWALGKIKGVHSCGEQRKDEKKNPLFGWDDTGNHQGFDVCSDDHCQRYQGIQKIPETTFQAIKETSGIVLTDSQGELADTRFSKCCGGRTEIFSTCWQPRDFSYLRSLHDPWCDLSQLSPKSRRVLLSSILKDYDQNTEGYGYRWTFEISKREIRENLQKKFGVEVGEVESLEILHRGPSGRADLMRVKGNAGTLEIGKELWIRRLLSPTHLYSSDFEIQDLGDSLRLQGKGWGHGVGLCQIGAARMAYCGFKYYEILEFYYPGTILTKL